MKIGIGTKLVAVAAGLFALAACGGAEPVGSTSDGLAGATFTTFDESLGGCIHSTNGINCNHYTRKDRVYLSGGPVDGSLEDGEYFFAILAPGNPTAALSDTAPGNLSGPVSSMSSRGFRVSNGEIVPGSQAASRDGGETPNGRFIIEAVPFLDTPNPGGVYILAVCIQGATGPSDCKYDAFKVRERKKDCPPKKDKDKKDGYDGHGQYDKLIIEHGDECKDPYDGHGGGYHDDHHYAP